MSPQVTLRRLKAALATLGALALIAALAVLSPVARAADDVDLLRRQGGKPFVFFLIDTSGSMALDPDDGWMPGSGDDPGSKMFQVKKALYDVLTDVEGVHFGLASFNQDRLMVRSKHWLYRADAAVDLGPLTYPSAAGEVWTFGRHVNANGEAGTCASPLAFSSARQQLDRFPRLGVKGEQETVLWVENGGKTYRLGISLSGSSPGGLGSPVLVVEAEADEVKKCDPVEVAVHGTPTSVTLSRVRDFLMVESNGVPSGTDDDNCTGDETMASVWPYTDVLAENTCGSGSSAPHTGQGAETNTDSGDRPDPFFPGDDPPYDHDDLDRCCVTPGVSSPVCKETPAAGDVCYNLRFPTALHPEFDELDRGDQIPLHWEVEYKDEFLRRLNPLHPGGPDFGIASYFQDEPDPVTGLLQLEDEQQRPLVAFGNSPLGRAINDFRCWYLGDDSNKCKGPSFDPGWEAVFRDNDLEYGCRIPYLIVISDGEDNSRGNNPTSDVSNLFSKAGVRTFVFTFESTDQLHSIVQSGKGELILVENGEDLATRLREIIGFIQEESRIFASAAVPSVQATVADKIYLTNFTPLNGAGAWDGHVHAFLEPLPIDTLTRRPDFDHPNHLWDAGEVMLDQSPAPVAGDASAVGLQIGSGMNERRVYYAREAVPGDSDRAAWPDNREFFDRPTTGIGGDVPLDHEPDLWNGLGISYDPSDPDSVRAARKTAHEVIEKTLIQKAYSSPDTGSLTYILGDIFHSNPLVIGGPSSTKYFILDAEVENGGGYRDFFLEHENRRKILVAGANDGMLHAWDAGKARIVEFSDQFDIRRRAVRFDNGTGRELFAYIPRTLLPAVRDLALTPLSHRWGVDAPAVAADIFVDPLHGGVPDPDDREWRTVIVGGLREGGSGYFALDATYPDHLADDFTGPVEDPDLQFPARIPTDQAVIPDCLDSTGGACGTLRYPAPLWEFTDRIWDPVGDGDGPEWVVLDEDANTRADLGETWATPDVGRIRVWENGALINKYVAVFGGGLDPDKVGSRGNFVYIVDMETAQVLYKRPVAGSVPGDTAAVDTDQDSYFDRIYFGTTEGLLYRIDLIDDDATSDDDRYPTLVDTSVNGLSGLNGRTYTVPRIESGSSTEPLWEPVAIFSTGGRPIYYPPSVLFVAKLGRWALGFGTGDRDALGFKSNHDGRFYTFVDDSDLAGVSLPLDESDLERIDVTEGTNPDLLTTGTPGERGWFMALDLEERLISPPFGLLGVTFFATFDPQVVNETCEVGPGCNQNPQCSLSGNSRVYIVNTTNADAFLVDVAEQPTRFIEVTGFVTEPFANESGLTQLEGVDGTPEPPPDDTGDEACGGPETEAQRQATQAIMQLFPSVCNFSSQTIDMGFFMANMECERIVKVPICVIEKNWKELGE